MCGRSRVGQIQGVVIYLSTEFGLGEVLDRIGIYKLTKTQLKLLHNDKKIAPGTFAYTRTLLKSV